MGQGLLAVGTPPKVTRSRIGRRPGKWRGHEQMAVELRTVASREKDPDKQWGQVAERAPEHLAQAIVSAIKKGEAVGFEHTEGVFEAISRKCPNQNRAPISPSTKEPYVLYDVWARFVSQSGEDA